MNGLTLSREYFFDAAEPELKRAFPKLYPRLAAGLVGNGSECFGYDDEISRDHDWGVDFFIWTLDDDRAMIPALQEWKDNLFNAHPPKFTRSRSEYGARVGVMSCGDFYYSLIGAPEAPTSLREWIRAPEENFAMAVNGEVFIDGPGRFLKTRELILGGYPEDLRLKRLAAKCMALAQTGQYNHGRVALRKDWVTLRSVLSRFNDSAIAMTFLLNRAHRPYYKWAHRAVSDLRILGKETARLLLMIAELGGLDTESQAARQRYISELCTLFVCELKAQNLTDSDDWFLSTHGEEIQSRIKEDFLRNLPTQYEI